MSAPPDGYLGNAENTNTGTNGRRSHDPRKTGNVAAWSSLTRAYPNAEKEARLVAENSQPQPSGISGAYYEDLPLRHNREDEYQRAVPAFPPFHSSVSNYYPDPAAMSLSYETRTFPDYPNSTMMHDPHQQEEDNSIHHNRYPSPPPPLSDNPYNAQPIDTTSALNIEEIPELQTKEESDAPSPGRSKPIPKPDREVTKGDDGRYVCTWVGCTEEVRTFNRKCEWSKHMDKHDRPYKCPADGCEKLPGFTYSGGLLRHQREVHNLHGGKVFPDSIMQWY
jgi:hypothetical protein